MRVALSQHSLVECSAYPDTSAAAHMCVDGNTHTSHGTHTCTAMHSSHTYHNNETHTSLDFHLPRDINKCITTKWYDLTLHKLSIERLSSNMGSIDSVTCPERTALATFFWYIWRPLYGQSLQSSWGLYWS